MHTIDFTYWLYKTIALVDINSLGQSGTAGSQIAGLQTGD